MWNIRVRRLVIDKVRIKGCVCVYVSQLPCCTLAVRGYGSGAGPESDRPVAAPASWAEAMHDLPLCSPPHKAWITVTGQTKTAAKDTKFHIKSLNGIRNHCASFLMLEVLLSGWPGLEDGFWMWHCSLTQPLLGSQDPPSLLLLLEWHHHTRHAMLWQTYPAEPVTTQFNLTRQVLWQYDLKLHL